MKNKKKKKLFKRLNLDRGRRENSFITLITEETHSKVQQDKNYHKYSSSTVLGETECRLDSIWPPGHSGVERAKCPVTRRARKTMIRPEPFGGVLRGHFNNLLSRWAQKKSNCHWKYSAGQEYAKSFIESSGTAHNLQRDVRLVTRFMQILPREE